MEVAAYVPIKLNNERAPGKNIKEFDDGRPLCSLMFHTLIHVRGIDHIYCYCSDEQITGYLPEGIEFLKRPAALDLPTTQCHDIITSFIEKVDADMIVLCHATCPFVKVSSIETCIEKVRSGQYDSAFTVELLQDFLWENGEPLNFDPNFAPKTQELSPIYKESIGCYVFTKDLFCKTNRKVGLKPYLCEVDQYETVDIDYPDDFKIANAIYMHILKPEIDREGCRK